VMSRKNRSTRLTHGGRGRREVQMKPGMLGQPFVYFGMFVGRIVADDQMQCQGLVGLSVNYLQELEELVVPTGHKWRCLGWHWPITVPVLTSSAANKVVPPSRISPAGRAGCSPAPGFSFFRRRKIRWSSPVGTGTGPPRRAACRRTAGRWRP
jgi:hypothetical protein